MPAWNPGFLAARAAVLVAIVSGPFGPVGISWAGVRGARAPRLLAAAAAEHARQGAQPCPSRIAAAGGVRGGGATPCAAGRGAG